MQRSRVRGHLLRCTVVLSIADARRPVAGVSKVPTPEAKPPSGVFPTFLVACHGWSYLGYRPKLVSNDSHFLTDMVQTGLHCSQANKQPATTRLPLLYLYTRMMLPCLRQAAQRLPSDAAQRVQNRWPQAEKQQSTWELKHTCSGAPCMGGGGHASETKIMPTSAWYTPRQLKRSHTSHVTHSQMLHMAFSPYSGGRCSLCLFRDPNA